MIASAGTVAATAARKASVRLTTGRYRGCRMLTPVLERVRRAELGPLAAYVAVSFLYFGRPVAHPGRLLIGQGPDPGIFVWSLAWWPHALLHGQNPIYTNAIFAPDG